MLFATNGLRRSGFFFQRLVDFEPVAAGRTDGIVIGPNILSIRGSERESCDGTARIRISNQRSVQAAQIGSDVVNPWQRELGAEPAEIELAQEHHIRYWSDWFRCTPIELLAVVGRVGRSIPLVEAEIARRAAIKEHPVIR